jgi:hypothetical protein
MTHLAISSTFSRFFQTSFRDYAFEKRNSSGCSLEDALKIPPTVCHLLQI